MSSIEAEVRFGTKELRDDIPFFVETLGMRMDMIYPADDPRVAVFSGYGLRVRIEKGASETTGTLRILSPQPDRFANGSRTLTAPNGIRVEIDQLNPPLKIPETLHSFVVRRLVDQSPWIIGRAGMYYRDLVPGILGSISQSTAQIFKQAILDPNRNCLALRAKYDEGKLYVARSQDAAAKTGGLVAIRQETLARKA